MNRYVVPSYFLKLSLEELEKTLDKYLKIVEDSYFGITPDFERELIALTALAKAKGSTRKW